MALALVPAIVSLNSHAFLPCKYSHRKKNWLFSWAELGTKHIGIVQSLLATCRLHDSNPFTYFVNVLQRVAQHPASLSHHLTPRIWKAMLPRIRDGRTCMIWAGDVTTPPHDRLLLVP